MPEIHRLRMPCQPLTVFSFPQLRLGSNARLAILILQDTIKHRGKCFRVFDHAIALDQFCEARIRSLSLLRRCPLGKDTLPLVVHAPSSVDEAKRQGTVPERD